MGLLSRVGRLEKISDARPVAPCPQCGAPKGWVPILSIKTPEGVELLPTCPRCGFTLNAHGAAMHALPPGGVQKVVVLDWLPPL